GMVPLFLLQTTGQPVAVFGLGMLCGPGYLFHFWVRWGIWDDFGLWFLPFVAFAIFGWGLFVMSLYAFATGKFMDVSDDYSRMIRTTRIHDDSDRHSAMTCMYIVILAMNVLTMLVLLSVAFYGGEKPING
ncbi:MAG TPA: hypothetical protein VJA26_17430, partial [Gammaproteobacteria bacterium]|nr:hypothetical protein [Gammaproteobacteria bacterium]